MKVSSRTKLTRRETLKWAALLGVASQLPGPLFAQSAQIETVHSTGNPFIPGRGVADPQIRVFGNEVYLYATHDASPDNKDYVMHDWWVWHSRDLVEWRLVSTLTPDQTYLRKPSTECWATDAARRNGKYYFYFSMGPEEIGVVVGDTPAGPWRDPLGKALIAKGDVATASRDPGILQEADGTSYIVFGTWDYYIARLNEDMISLAEEPRLIEIRDKAGPYGAGRTDDKPFLHRRGDLYYLSWGSFYGIGTSPYGPFTCKGPLLKTAFADPIFDGSKIWRLERFLKAWFNLDRHGSFFELNGQWYFACNDQSLPGSTPHFRNPVISYVHYRENGEIAPLRLTQTGVGQYTASQPIRAAEYFNAAGARVRDAGDDRFGVSVQQDGAHLLYPKVRDIQPGGSLTLTGANRSPGAVRVEVRRGGPQGEKLAGLAFMPGATQAIATDIKVSAIEDICFVFSGMPGPDGVLLFIETIAFA